DALPSAGVVLEVVRAAGEHAALQRSLTERHTQVCAAILVRPHAIVQAQQKDTLPAKDQATHLARPEFVCTEGPDESHQPSSSTKSTRSSGRSPTDPTVLAESRTRSPFLIARFPEIATRTLTALASDAASAWTVSSPCTSTSTPSVSPGTNP